MGCERTKGRKLLKQLDRIYFRFKNAYQVFRDPELMRDEYNEGLELGMVLGQAKIKAALDMSDPHEFSNNHFKLGYYYAYETVKKVTNGNDNALV